MSGVNKVILLGRLGKDVELKYAPSGEAYANLSIATSDIWFDKDGNRQEATEWHNVTAWKKNAENCAKYLKKGDSLFVEGKIKTRSWEDKNTKEKKYATYIEMREMSFVDNGNRGGQQQSQPQQQQQQQRPAQQKPVTAANLDEIPF